MKMPRRPFFPPVKLPPDIFGLHDLTLLEQAGETEEETRKRVARVEEGVVAAFKAAVRHLSEEEARRLFRRVIRRPKRGKGKMLAPDRDARLLREYDAVAILGKPVIAALARRLRAEGTELGNTENAIATQISKLVREREVREHKAAVEARRWRMATRGETTLLSEAVAKK